MAGPGDVFERSMSINAKFLPRLQAAVEQNALLRIGWTGSGEEVPKNGEVGLCPAMPEGARINALGKLGSWTSSFGHGGSFDIEGEAGAFFGAYNHGSKLSASGFIGRCAGFMMQGGELTGEDGADDDLGMFMNDGLIFVRGDVGQRIGNGMTGGMIVVQGNVGNDAGCGMKDGQIIIEGRCPTPPHGTQLRPLTASELKKINKVLDSHGASLGEDAFCLESSNNIEYHIDSSTVSSGDLSSIAITPMEESPLIENYDVDTAAFILGTDEETLPVLLPLPILPYVPDGSVLSSETNSSGRLSHIQTQPFLVEEHPRPIDILYLNLRSLCTLPEYSDSVAGACLDFDSLPALNDEELEGLLVILRTLLRPESPILACQGISRIQNLHKRTVYHNLQVAVSRIEDGTGIPEAATLPIIGRSVKTNLENSETTAALEFGFTCDAHDIIVARCAGAQFVITQPPVLETEDMEFWLQGLTIDMKRMLRNLGLESIDQVKRAHLRALDYDTAAISGLRMVGYERPLPHWFAR
ncbi:MAG: Uncharacterised protein [Euryarchaeota archaeon UBA443]|jgi:hypothetical protein|nr:MAG: Uncharacterised protein [Euryarchaeota archaeon UBA443]|tara:strand:- start:23623 stop:25200 length:1578 start_codon:yes stop_codon:yes gene_type:complete